MKKKPNTKLVRQKKRLLIELEKYIVLNRGTLATTFTVPIVVVARSLQCLLMAKDDR